jgi:hypothetical protein
MEFMAGVFIGLLALGGSKVDTPGDFDFDGDVDLVDFAEFQLCVPAVGDRPTPICLAAFDFDTDGDIDLVDFGGFTLAFTGPGTKGSLIGPLPTAITGTETTSIVAPSSFAFDQDEFFEVGDEIAALVDTTILKMLNYRTADFGAVQCDIYVYPDGMPPRIGDVLDATALLAPVRVIPSMQSPVTIPGSDGLPVGGYNIVLDCGVFNPSPHPNGSWVGENELGRGDAYDGFLTPAPQNKTPGFWVQRNLSVPGDGTSVAEGVPFTSFTFDDANLHPIVGPFDDGGSSMMRSRGVVVHPDALPAGQSPLVTFSHGNTGVINSYLGYLYLQEHLAGYGYATVSIDMFPAHVSVGIRRRAVLTNYVTDRMIRQQPTYPIMGGGILNGRIDGSRVITVGHSRGGESAQVQLNQIRDPSIPDILPPNITEPSITWSGFNYDSFHGVSPISQVTFLMGAETETLAGSNARLPGYLQIYGAADADVCGCFAEAQPFRHFDRARTEKASVYLYGAGHGYFNDFWLCFCSGPDLLTLPQVQAATLGYLVPWIQMVDHQATAERGLFQRSPEEYRPESADIVPSVSRIVTQFLPTQEGDYAAQYVRVIDDFEMEPDEAISSSCGIVDFNVTGLIETELTDAPYLRSGGWATAFRTMRVGLSNFPKRNIDLDLSNIVALRFLFGTAGALSSDTGRIGIDDIQLLALPEYPEVLDISSECPALVIPDSLSVGNDEFSSYGLGFDFPFYGSDYDTVYIGSNGFVTFGSGNSDFNPDLSSTFALFVVNGMTST